MVLQTRRQSTEAYNGLDEKAIEEEIAAQFFGVVFSSESQIRKTVAEASTEERGFLRKIIARLNRFIENIKRNLTMYGVNDKTVKAALMMEISEAEEMARQFEVALNEAAKKEKPTTETGGVKKSLSVIGLDAYNKDSINKIKMRNGVIVNSISELKNYVSEALSGDVKQNLHLGAIPKTVIAQIENDINEKIFTDKQYTFVVSYDDIRHVSEHFADVDELTNEILRLYDILSNYDSVECLIEENGRKKLRLEKAYAHAEYRSIEIVSNKNSSVDLISFYVTKKHNKKGSQSVPPATQGSLSGGARLPNNTVSQNTQSVNNNDMQNSKKYSYAGIGAKTHNIKTLEQAIRLEDVGKATSEEIRQQTGWFRGYDGEWRFEISDRDMEIDTTGKFSSNPDIRRYAELFNKAYVDMSATEAEVNELKTLEKNLKGVSTEPKTLGELIRHDLLFSAYPQFKDMKIHFADIDTRGVYDPILKEIVLQKKLKLEKGKLTKTLIHEIQHAIQDIEGFAGGSNPDYWRDMGIPEDKVREYYENTAGEIEARDAAIREWRTDEARKEKRPDIDRADVVFAEEAKKEKPTESNGGVKYSKQNPKKNSAKNKKSYYNETATIFMIWANSESTPVGSVLRQNKKGKVQFFLKTETGVLSIDKYEYEKIVSKENEYVRELNIIRKRNADADNGIYTDSGRRSSGNVHADGYAGDAKRSNIADERFTEKEPESGDFRDMANDGQYNSEISKDNSSALQSQKSEYKYSQQLINDTDVKKKFSKQLTAETEEGIEQIKAENETFGEYVDRVLSEISEKIADKRSPGQAKGYGRDAFIDIAREYNVYNYNERGYIRSRYSNNEIAVNIEHVLVGISEGILSARDGLTILSDIQENILSDGYDFDNTGVNVAFRQELKNKQIYVSENIYNELLERYGGKKKLRAASFNQLSIKPADDTHKENIKDIYEYLQKEYSELLAGASSEIGMIEDLIVTEREVRPKVSYYSKEYNFGGEMDIKEAATRRAAEILQKAFEVELVDIDIGNQYHQLLAAKRSLEDRKRFYKENLSKAADIRYKKEQKQVRKNGAFCEK